MEKTTLAVIGAGPGGYPTAFMAADLGIDVTLIDPEQNPGGVCLYSGCIPSKALLHVSKVLTEAKHASDWGINFSEPEIDIEKLRSWKNKVVNKLTGGLGQLSKQRKVKYKIGKAKFTDNKTLKIINENGNEELLSFDYAVIATGSRPATIPNLPTDPKNILDSTSALDIEEIPKSMLIVGGGYIGLELGTFYASLGTRVSVVEMTNDLMPGVDRDLVKVLEKRLSTIFDSIMLNTKVESLSENKKGINVTFSGEKLDKNEITFDKVLISVGRIPNSENLDLENTKIRIDKRGFILIDKTRRTDEPNIYAIGDVAGEPMLAHKATHEGRLVSEIIAGRDLVFEPKAIPAVVFTDPEISWCGLTETQARDEGTDIKVAKFPWGASGRATTLDRNDGLTKLIIDPQTERILGMGIVGTGAGELISEGVLAVEMAAVVSDIELSIHPHPTLSETVMETAESFYGNSTHIYRPKR